MSTYRFPSCSGEIFLSSFCAYICPPPSVSLTHLACYPMGTELAEAQRGRDFPQECDHIHVLDETLKKSKLHTKEI